MVFYRKERGDSVTYFDEEAGARIRKMRERAGYSREKLSEMADISTKFLYEIESGRKGMSVYTLYHLCKALDVSCDYILSGEDKSKDKDYGPLLSILSRLNNEQLAHIEQIARHICDIAEINDK